MITRPLGPEHLSAVAALHCQCLPGDFLPSLGPRFLEVLYSGMLELDVAFGQVALDGSQLVGFSLGTLDSGGLFGRVLQRRFLALSLQLARALLRRPQLLWPSLETLRYPAKESAAGAPRAELLVIGVRADRRSQGLGQRLVEELETDLVSRGAPTYKVTVLERNHDAQRFYGSLGFAQAHRFRLYRKDWLLYTKATGKARETRHG